MVLYLVYPGLGKTFSAKMNPNVLEVQVGMFRDVSRSDLGDHYPEKLKGAKREEVLNPDFPNNLIDFLGKQENQDKIIVMALKQNNMQFAIDHGYDIAFVMPTKNKLRQIKQQYKLRGNTDEYIARQINMYEPTLEKIKQYTYPILFVDEGQYLLDLINLGIIQ